MPKEKRSDGVDNRLPKKQATISISKKNKAQIGIVQNMLNVAGYNLKGKNIGFIANDAISYLLKLLDVKKEIDVKLFEEILNNNDSNNDSNIKLETPISNDQK